MFFAEGACQPCHANLSRLLLSLRCCAEEEAQALGLRHQGNDAFKAGELRKALDFYWRAVQVRRATAAVCMT